MVVVPSQRRILVRKTLIAGAKSYFGTQEGEFRLILNSIRARKEPKEAAVQLRGSETDLQRTTGSMI